MFTINHFNINVFDLEKSLSFYEKALKMHVVRTNEAADGSFVLKYISDEKKLVTIELTWLRDRKERYNLGDNEFHIAFVADDFEKAYELHKSMGCICFENKAMGIYFIADPDGYWLEVVPQK